MRIALFRAAEDGRRTAARLAALGHSSVLLPVMHIEPTGRSVQPGSGDALIFTSAHAPKALIRSPEKIAPLRSLPCWCVGERTAAAARDAGFETVDVLGGDAAGLARALIDRGSTRRVVFVTGRNRKLDLERALTAAGVAVSIVEAYAAAAVAAWEPADAATLKNAEAALHYSRRSASLALRLAEEAGHGETFRRLTHHCLSADVAAALDGAERDHLVVARRPDEESLLATLAPLAKVSFSR